MAIWVRTRKDGKKSYTVRWRDLEGVWQSRTERTLRAAEKLERKMMGAVESGNYVDPKRGKKPLAEATAEMIEGKRAECEPKTIYGYESIHRAHIKDSALGKRPVASIKTSDIKRFLGAKKAAGLSSDTRRQIRQLLHATFAFLMDEDEPIVMRNPVTRGTAQKKDPKRKVTPFTPDEVHEIPNGMDDRYRALVYLMAVHGPRWGEASSRRRKHYDAASGKLDIPDAVSNVGGRLIHGDNKTHQRRVVVLAPFLREIMAEHLEKYVPDDDEAALLFTTPTGKPLRADNWRTRVWKPALEAAGLDPTREIRDLRNSGISQAVAHGASSAAVAEMVGNHETVTINTYRRITQGEDEQLTSVIENVWKPKGD